MFKYIKDVPLQFSIDANEIKIIVEENVGEINLKIAHVYKLCYLII